MRHVAPCQKGFTLIEILILLAIFGLLLTASVVSFSSFRRGSAVENSAQDITSILQLAQSRTLASEGDTQYGVYFDNTTSPHQYVLFEGSDYASRNVSADEVHGLTGLVVFSSISFAGGQEVVFDRVTGTIAQPGTVDLEHVSDPSQTQTVLVESSGNIELGSGAVPTDADRQKDTRHMHVTYGSRTIANDEIIHITAGGVIKDLLVSDYMSGGQFGWEGEIDVAGDKQKLKIHTHSFNSGVPNATEFCIHRDQRYNDQPLTIELDGSPDPDPGTLISYDAMGNVTQGTSIYASAPVAQ